MAKEIYYDLATKQEIPKQNLRPNIPYIEFKPYEKWKIRIVEFDETGKITERLFTQQEEDNAKKEILIQKFIQKGYEKENIEISKNDKLLVNDNILINVPNYEVSILDGQEKKENSYFNTQNLEDMVRDTSYGKEITISNITLSSGFLIDILNEPEYQNSADSKESVRNSDVEQKYENVIINFDQWGFKKSYNIKNKEELARLREEASFIPRNEREAREQRYSSNEQEQDTTRYDI